jgi:hypothetical protein
MEEENMLYRTVLWYKMTMTKMYLLYIEKNIFWQFTYSLAIYSSWLQKYTYSPCHAYVYEYFRYVKRIST